MKKYKEIEEKLTDYIILRDVKLNSINTKMIDTFYEIGKLLDNEYKKYGDEILYKYSNKLSNNISNFNIDTLKFAIKFYRFFQKNIPLKYELSFKHYQLLMNIEDENEILYYMKIAINKCLNVYELNSKIIADEYHVIDEINRNKILNDEFSNVQDINMGKVITISMLN